MLWLVVLLVVVVVVVAWSARGGPYRQLPGPRRLPLVGSALAFIGCSRQQLWELPAAMFARYGGRFAVKVCHLHVLHVRDRDDVAAVLSHSRNITKNTPYDFMRPLLGNGLLTSTGRTWYTRRRTLTPAFHSAVLEQFLPAFREGGRRLTEELVRAQRQTAAVDLLPIVSKHTLHTLCCTAMGLDQNTELEGLEEYEDAILNLGRLATARLTNVLMHSDLVFYMLPIGRRFQKYAHIARRFADQVILKKRAQGNKDEKKGLMDLLLEAESRGDIDMDGVRDEVNTFLFAGHETTAAAVTFGLMLLAEREDIQERLQWEYVSAGAAPSAGALAALPLLEAVVRELLRLYPSAPVLSRLVDHDFDMNGVAVRRGTHVAVHLYQLQRRPDLFPEPHAFRPERFAAGPRAPPFATAPFSAGPRNCIGQKFARLELKCYLGEAVRRLRLTAAAPRPPLCADLVLRTAEPVRVRLRPR